VIPPARNILLRILLTLSYSHFARSRVRVFDLFLRATLPCIVYLGLQLATGARQKFWQVRNHLQVPTDQAKYSLDTRRWLPLHKVGCKKHSIISRITLPCAIVSGAPSISSLSLTRESHQIRVVRLEIGIFIQLTITEKQYSIS